MKRMMDRRRRRRFAFVVAMGSVAAPVAITCCGNDPKTHPPVEDSTGSDASSSATSDSSSGGQGDSDIACGVYCRCVTSTCRTLTGYPYVNVTDCLAKCGAFNGEEKSCWPKWCVQAETVIDNTHVCEHAWGKYALEECNTL